MSSANTPAAPPEVDATLSRLTAHKNVQGVLILARPSGIVLRSSGALFALPAPAPSPESPSKATPTDATGGSDSTEPTEPKTVSDLALKYSRLALRVVESVGEEVRSVVDGDDLRFLRIRTKRHELMITPDELYILVVVQDPTH